MQLYTRLTAVGFTLLLLGALALSACGQKGPLYLPKERPGTEQGEKKRSGLSR